MKKVLAVCYVLTTILMAPRIASAQCTISTPTGPWGFSIRGFDAAAPFADAGIIVFNGNGGLTITGQTNLGEGGYSVSSNCTFTLVLSHYPISFFTGVFVNMATEFRLVATQNEFAVAGSGKSISNGSGITCNNASPAGAWGYDMQGFMWTTSPYAASGTIVFDGAGRLTISEGFSQSGAITLTEAYGVYSVNPDCSFSMSILGVPGFSYGGVFVNGLTEFRIADTTPGDGVTGSGNIITAPVLPPQ